MQWIGVGLKPNSNETQTEEMKKNLKGQLYSCSARSWRIFWPYPRGRLIPNGENAWSSSGRSTLHTMIIVVYCCYKFN